MEETVLLDRDVVLKEAVELDDKLANYTAAQKIQILKLWRALPRQKDVADAETQSAKEAVNRLASMASTPRFGQPQPAKKG